MIDAYEIGIQLLLQDDVSAGLAVINRELAEVDRAIAATSSGLVGLVHGAGRSAIAVSAGGSQHVAAAPKAEDESSEPSSERSAHDAAAISVITQFPETSGEQPAASAVRAADWSAQEAMATAAPSGEPEILWQPSGAGQAVSSNAPVAASVAEHAVSIQRPEQPTAEKEIYQPMAQAAVAPATVQRAEPGPHTAPSGASTASDARPLSTVTPSQVALTASISRAQRPEAVGQRAEPMKHYDGGHPVAKRQLPAASWSGMEQVAPRPDMAGFPPSAAAPKALEQSSEGASGGNVMLDGRLVGKWLSEHMAREASRPPAGTSFFDPRQTPAWNVSGAL